MGSSQRGKSDVLGDVGQRHYRAHQAGVRIRFHVRLGDVTQDRRIYLLVSSARNGRADYKYSLVLHRKEEGNNMYSPSRFPGILAGQELTCRLYLSTVDPSKNDDIEEDRELCLTNRVRIASSHR
jgi:hypothetical protein